MDAHREESRRRFVLPFIGFSLLAHVQAILIAVAVMSLNPEGCRQDADIYLDPVEVALVTDSPDPRDVAKKIEEEAKEEDQQERDAEGQVVELPRPAEEVRPDKSRFLSEYDSRVDRETKARARPTKPGAATPRKRALQPQQRRVPAKGQPTPKTEEVKLAMREPTPDAPESELKEAQKGDIARRQKQQRRQQQPVKPGVSPDAPSVRAEDLMLSDEALADVLRGSVNDALTDVDEGETTLLNSKRWRFASFFNRVKRQVAQVWHPDRAYRRRDPTGNVYGFRDRLTILRVKLDPQGELKKVHLEKASGLGFLDDEAMNAFRQAEPFPNPPRGLVDKQTGLISFRFGFLFEISRSPSFRVFRYRN